MLKKVLFGFTTFGLMVASAASYRVTLLQDSTVKGKQLKAGDYKLEVKDSGVVLKQGKEEIDLSAKTETAPKKFNRTAIRYNSAGEMQDISIGGTSTKVVFNSDATASGGSL